MVFLEIYNFFFTKCLLSCIAFKKNMSYNYIACQIDATTNAATLRESRTAYCSKRYVKNDKRKAVDYEQPALYSGH